MALQTLIQHVADAAVDLATAHSIRALLGSLFKGCDERWRRDAQPLQTRPQL